MSVNEATMATLLGNISNSTQGSESTVGVVSSRWFIPRIINSLVNAVLDQASELLSDQRIQGTQVAQAAQDARERLQDVQMDRVMLNFNYFVSPYAGVCMLMAILLNRTVVFASSRTERNTRRRSPSNLVKIFLRLVAVGFLLRMVVEVLLELTLYSTSLKTTLVDLNSLVSDQPLKRLRTHVLLWRIFLVLCFSQFIETFVSIVSGHSPSNDTGLTLFEQSLAFQETQFLKNPPLQLLVIISFSLINQLIIQILGIANLHKYQLIPSTIMGLSFLIFYTYSAFTGDLIQFPWIVVVTIIPQLTVLLISSFCLGIYGLASLIKGSSEDLTYTPMMRNLKGSLNLQLNDDFNSVLMRFGLVMFNAVDNEDYVNEYSSLISRKQTYLDDNNENEGISHLLSGYLNKIEDNHKFMKSLRNENSTLPLKGENNSSISNSWSLLKKYLNLVALLQSLYLLVSKHFKQSMPSKPKLTEIPDNLVNPFRPLSPLTLSRQSSPTPYTATIIGENVLIDDSEDFEYESELESDPLEFDSDFEEIEQTEYIPTLSALRNRERLLQISTDITRQSPKIGAINELLQPNDLLQIINPTSIEDISLLNSLRTHLSQDKRITRSKYAELNPDDLLREVILNHRQLHSHEEHDKSFSNDLDNPEFTDTPCVVCQANQRSIIIWPCKCFALCETCRVSLGARGFKICVCCRSAVEGFSKVYTP